MEQASRVLFYISDASLASDHCNREINLALDDGKAVLPVYLESVELTSDLRVGLSRVQALHRDQDGYERHLLTALGQSVAADRSTVHDAPTAPTRAHLASVPQALDAATEPHLPTIAAMPLENLSGDPEQEYVADGMTEELITELARLGGLRVISRTSVMHYKGSRPPLSRVVDELNVDWVLEGTVAREASRIRVTVQLIDARTGTHRWSDRFDRQLSSVLALRSEIAHTVALQLRLELTPDEQDRLSTSRPVNEDAYDAYLQATTHIKSDDADARWKAIEDLEHAVALDPGFAKAWSSLGGLHLDAALTRPERFPQAREATEAALSLDSRLGAAHTLLGYLALYDDRDLVAAEAAFEAAMRLSPSSPRALHGYSSLLRFQERFDELLPVARRLLQVAPLDRYYRPFQAQILAHARLYELALDEGRRVAKLWPDFLHRELPFAYRMLGRFEDLQRFDMLLYERSGARSDSERQAVESGWLRNGHEGALRARLEYRAARAPRPLGYVSLAEDCAWLGEMDRAFEWVERAVEVREGRLAQLPWLFTCDPMRLDPRFDPLLRRLDLPVHPERPARMADVGRIMAFRGRAPEAISRLAWAMAESPNDLRLSRWLESMAYAHFALGDYEQAASWAESVLERDLSTHADAFAHLLLTSSYVHLDRVQLAREALAQGLESWPRLEIDRDLVPLFMGGDTDMRDRYVAGLHKAGFED